MKTETKQTGFHRSLKEEYEQRDNAKAKRKAEVSEKLKRECAARRAREDLQEEMALNKLMSDY